jgi:uncharacterized membrane protein YccC
MKRAQLRMVGVWIIVGTLVAAAFAVAGAFVGPGKLVGTLLLIGGSVIAVAYLLEREERRRAEDQKLGEEGNYR